MTSSTPRLVSVMYHYIRDVEGTAFPGIKAVSVPDFRQQVAKVQQNFDTPPLEACVEFLEGTWEPKRDLCILTFDDGLREHSDTAAQILSDAGVPGAFFLPTAAVEDNEVLAVHMNHFLLASLGTAELSKYLDEAAREIGIAVPPAPRPDAVQAVYRWDDHETARLKYLVNHQLPAATSERLLLHVFSEVLGPPPEFARSLYLDWQQARAMQEAGFAIGGHTHRHKVLSAMEDAQQLEDLGRSMTLLESHLGPGRRGLAYPYGKPSTYTAMTIRNLADLGYYCAFNTAVDDGRLGTSRWEIPRIDPKDL